MLILLFLTWARVQLGNSDFGYSFQQLSQAWWLHGEGTGGLEVSSCLRSTSCRMFWEEGIHRIRFWAHRHPGYPPMATGLMVQHDDAKAAQFDWTFLEIYDFGPSWEQCQLTSLWLCNSNARRKGYRGLVRGEKTDNGIGRRWGGCSIIQCHSSLHIHGHAPQWLWNRTALACIALMQFTLQV